ALVERAGGDALAARDLGSQATIELDLGREVAHRLFEGVEERRLGGARVDAEHCRAGDDVERARLDVELADGGDGAAAGSARRPLDAEDDLGGAGERVLAQMHRRRAGVVEVADDADDELDEPRDGGDGADVELLRLEDAALLDVELEERGDRAGGP